jgi:alpha-glucosidase (family GH31 glycosyl hydrolase)
MMGPSGDKVVQQYTDIVGKPYMIPYWSLGWVFTFEIIFQLVTHNECQNQCKWGYRTIQETIDVVLEYEKYGIPLDTMWNDIDYMDAYKDFTLDPTRFPTDLVKKVTFQKIIEYFPYQNNSLSKTFMPMDNIIS